MNSDEYVNCGHCKSWISLKGYSALGYCLRKCEWIVKSKRKYVTKACDPLKGATSWCIDFIRKE